MEKFSFFWGGEYSQWYKSDIRFKHGKDREALDFNCAEQMMMYGKAMFFGDTETAENIMKAKDPKKQKALGRQVKGFDPDRWEAVAWFIVYAANACKFAQHSELYDKMMNDPAEEFVEASPYDKIWGIGLAADDPRALDKKTWQGLNLLGHVLTSVRRFFRGEEGAMKTHKGNMIIAGQILYGIEGAKDLKLMKG